MFFLEDYVHRAPTSSLVLCSILVSGFLSFSFFDQLFLILLLLHQNLTSSWHCFIHVHTWVELSDNEGNGDIGQKYDEDNEGEDDDSCDSCGKYGDNDDEDY